MRNLYVILTIVLFSGCAQKLPVKEYIKWVEDEKNGLLIKQSFQGNEISLQFQPLEYVALLNLREKKVDQKSIQTEIAGLNGYYYFSFKIQPSVQVNANQDYFNFQLESRFLLIQGTDSAKCAFFHQESTLNFSPYLTFVLIFKNEKVFHNNLVFLYKDEYLGLGTVKFEIDKASIKNIPSLKFE